MSFTKLLIPLLLVWGYTCKLSAQTWDGDAGATDRKWSTAANWNSNVAPLNNGTANILFPGLPNQNSSNVDVPWSIHSLSFTVTNAWRISGAELTIGSDGILSPSSTKYIENSIVLADSQTWGTSGVGAIYEIGSAGTTLSIGAHTLNIPSTSGITLRSVVTGSGTLNIAGRLYSNDASTASLFTGTLNLTGGEWDINSDTSLGGINTKYTFDDSEVDFFRPVKISGPGVIGNGGLVAKGFSDTNVFEAHLRGEIASSLTGPGFLHVASGRLTLTGNNSYAGGTRIASGGGVVGNTNSIQGNITGIRENGAMTGNGGLVFDQAFDATFAGDMTGYLTLSKRGSGVLTLTGRNDFTGTLGIQEGTLRLASPNSMMNASELYMENNTSGTFDMNGYDTTFGSVDVFAKSGSIKLGSGTLKFIGGTYLYANISGTGGLTFNSASDSLVLGGINLYSGPTTILKGNVSAEGGNAIGDLSTVILADATSTAISFKGTTSETIGALSGGGTLGGGVFLSAQTLTIGMNNSGTSYAGVITGAGKIAKTGTGTQSLTGINTYSGGTNLNQGAIEVSANTALGNASGALTFNGGVLRILGTSFTSTTRGITWGANGGGFDIANAANTFNLTQTLTGAGSFRKAGDGTLVFSANESYSGVTTIDGGILRSANRITGAGGTVTIGANGTLEASGTISRNIAGSGKITAIGSLTMGNSASPTGFNFTGTLAVGSNAVGLADSNLANLGGTTTLAAGTLFGTNGINLTGSISGYGIINGSLTNLGTVTGTNSGFPLLFNGVVNGTGSFLGYTKFAGVFSPGLSPAQVSLESPFFANNLLMELGGVNAGTQYDQLLISGAATLDGTLNVALLNSFVPSPGDHFLLLSGGILTGAFDTVNLPSLSNPNWSWQIDSDSDSFAITVVPEPSVGLLVLLGSMFLLMSRRFINYKLKALA